MNRLNEVVLFPLSLVMVLFFSSCEEIGPIIELVDENAVDTTYVTNQIEIPQEKNILLEEFTGVRCVNCPEGHELMDDLEHHYGSRFIGVSAHSEFLAEPYDGDQDLRTQDAQELENLLGPILLKPSAAIDRNLFSGESSLVHFLQKWSSFVSQRLSETTPVNIHVESDYSSNGRKLNAIITIHYTQLETYENKLGVMLVEDAIITAQLGNSGIDSSYYHKRTLRKILTPLNGLLITAAKTPGRVVVKTFNFIVPQGWVAENLRVIAFIHRSGGMSEVLQVRQDSVF